ncbi:hypothetical protein AC578_3008 [Pseudocercospora eumusae]|uniref:Uncharacterized protein n=1 Tax=Pseudocercospora eumusae TaxID=321146 RepID=A0A139H1T5_9PEZI|nr:hypothetical protein AC578_3008 [Pseudocercospora eumusae]
MFWMPGRCIVQASSLARSTNWTNIFSPTEPRSRTPALLIGTLPRKSPMSPSQRNTERSTLQLLATRADIHRAADPFIENDKYVYLVVHEEHDIPADFHPSSGLSAKLVDKLHQPHVHPKQALTGAYARLGDANVAAVNVIKQTLTNWKDIVFIDIRLDDDDDESAEYEAVRMYHVDGGPMKVREHNTPEKLHVNDTHLRYRTVEENKEMRRYRSGVE